MVKFFYFLNQQVERIFKNKWLVISITIFFIFLYLFLRLYQIDKRISFDWDQERDANIAWEIVINNNFTLLGPRVVDDNGFFLAPYYTYLISLFYLISELNPIAGIFYNVFISIAFLITSFLIIRKIWDIKTYILFIFFWVLNPVILSFDTTSWNVSAIPIFTLLTIWFLYKFFNYQKYSSLWIFCLAITLGIGVNFHFQFIFVIFFVIIFLILFFIKNNFNFKNIFIFITSFLAVFLPLFLFDLRNDFLNLKLLINFFTSNSTVAQKDYISWIEVLNNAFKPLLFLDNKIFTLLTYFVLGVLTFKMKFEQKSFMNIFSKSFLALIIAIPIFYVIYGKRPSEYYFLFLYPFIILLISKILLEKLRYFTLIFFIAFITFVNYNNLINSLKINPTGLFYKTEAIKFIKSQLEKDNYNIGVKADLGRGYGFNYLFKYYNIEQYPDPKYKMIEIIIPKNNEKNLQEFGDIGILVNEN